MNDKNHFPHDVRIISYDDEQHENMLITYVTLFTLCTTEYSRATVPQQKSVTTVKAAKGRLGGA